MNSGGGAPYHKPWLSFAQQADLLARRGMDDAPDHLEVVETIGYYRLSGYCYPFRRLDKATRGRLDDFYPEATCRAASCA